MENYYSERAPVYEAVYQYPERQKELRLLESYIPKQFKGKKLLEIAAGTGYWTLFLAKEALSILATDATLEPLEELRNKNIKKVEVKQVDAYCLDDLPTDFDGAFAGLWLSHIPKQRYREFLTGLHSRLKSGAKVIFVDNSILQCERLPISRTDSFGNTYQNRELENGKSYEVLKNFPSEKALVDMTKEIARDQVFIQYENYWLFEYTVIN